MSHILIQNAGELPLWGMRLLGLSNKTEDKIGRFGTGLKESIALLMRLNSPPIIYSGTTRINFSVTEKHGQPEVCFRLSEQRDSFAAGEWHGLGIHPNFGHHDWNDPWMVFREIICNALDASDIDNLHHDTTSLDPSGVTGSTRVYIPCNPTTMKGYAASFDRILPLSPRNTLFTNAGNEIIEKDGPSRLAIFHKGVWVQESEKASIFDYNLPRIKLNESRSTDWYGVQSPICSTLANAPVALAKKIINLLLPVDDNTVDTGTFEYGLTDNLQYHITSASAGWRQGFEALYGEDAVICLPDRRQFNSIESAGHRAVPVAHPPIYAILKNCGVRAFESVVSKEVQAFDSTYPPDSKTQQNFDYVWRHLLPLSEGENTTKPTLKVFREQPKSTTITFGKYMDGTCYVNEEALGSSLELYAHIEEVCHHLSGADDGSRAFQTFLVKAVHHMMPPTKEFA